MDHSTGTPLAWRLTPVLSDAHTAPVGAQQGAPPRDTEARAWVHERVSQGLTPEPRPDTFSRLALRGAAGAIMAQGYEPYGLGLIGGPVGVGTAIHLAASRLSWPQDALISWLGQGRRAAEDLAAYLSGLLPKGQGPLCGVEEWAREHVQRCPGYEAAGIAAVLEAAATGLPRCAWDWPDCLEVADATSEPGDLCVGHAEAWLAERCVEADEIADETEAEITRISHS